MASIAKSTALMAIVAIVAVVAVVLAAFAVLSNSKGDSESKTTAESSDSHLWEGLPLIDYSYELNVDDLIGSDYEEIAYDVRFSYTYGSGTEQTQISTVEANIITGLGELIKVGEQTIKYESGLTKVQYSWWLISDESREATLVIEFKDKDSGKSLATMEAYVLPLPQNRDFEDQVDSGVTVPPEISVFNDSANYQLVVTIDRPVDFAEIWVIYGYSSAIMLENHGIYHDPSPNAGITFVDANGDGKLSTGDYFIHGDNHNTYSLLWKNGGNYRTIWAGSF